MGLPDEPMHGDSDDDFGGPPSPMASSGPPSPLTHEPAPIQDRANIFNNVEEPDEPNEADQTTLLQNEDESFALAPIETPVARGNFFVLDWKYHSQ